MLEPCTVSCPNFGASHLDGILKTTSCIRQFVAGLIWVLVCGSVSRLDTEPVSTSFLRTILAVAHLVPLFITLRDSKHRQTTCFLLAFPLRPRNIAHYPIIKVQLTVMLKP